MIGLVAAAAAAPVGAAELRGSYEVLWSGLRVAAFELAVESGPEDYRITYRARSVGFLAVLFPFSSEGASQGQRVGGELVPVSYAASSTRRDERNVWSVRFAPDGRASEVVVPPDDATERDPVPDNLRRGPDPGALALGALAAAAPGARRSGASFDGRRVVRFDLACPEREGEPGVLVCTVAGEQIAGWHRQWSDRGRGSDEAREPARVWLRAGLFGPGYWPERIEAQTRFGRVIARLAPDQAEEDS